MTLVDVCVQPSGNPCRVSVRWPVREVRSTSVTPLLAALCETMPPEEGAAIVIRVARGAGRADNRDSEGEA